MDRKTHLKTNDNILWHGGYRGQWLNTYYTSIFTLYLFTIYEDCQYCHTLALQLNRLGKICTTVQTMYCELQSLASPILMWCWYVSMDAINHFHEETKIVKLNQIMQHVAVVPVMNAMKTWSAARFGKISLALSNDIIWSMADVYKVWLPKQLGR